MTTPAFLPLPANEPLHATWPTPNQHLFATPEEFFARTRVNPDYGKPGFTRDCGQRFHRGCDIAPVRLTPAGRSTLVVFTDCDTGLDFESEEPVFLPFDEVFCVTKGVVHEVVTEEAASDFGKHVVVAHRWPCGGATFFTLYGHLAEVTVVAGVAIKEGDWLGRMGQTSRSADARNWMLIAPHLHFEVRDATGQAYDPVEFLRRFVRQDR